MDEAQQSVEQTLAALASYNATLRDALFKLRGEVRALAFTLDAVIATHPDRAAMLALWQKTLPTLTDELIDEGNGHLEEMERQGWQWALAHYSTLLEKVQRRVPPEELP